MYHHLRSEIKTLRDLKAHRACAARGFMHYAYELLVVDAPDETDWQATERKYLDLLDEIIKEVQLGLSAHRREMGASVDDPLRWQDAALTAKGVERLARGHWHELESLPERRKPLSHQRYGPPPQSAGASQAEKRRNNMTDTITNEAAHRARMLSLLARNLSNKAEEIALYWGSSQKNETAELELAGNAKLLSEMAALLAGIAANSPDHDPRAEATAWAWEQAHAEEERERIDYKAAELAAIALAKTAREYSEDAWYVASLEKDERKALEKVGRVPEWLPPLTAEAKAAEARTRTVFLATIKAATAATTR